MKNDFSLVYFLRPTIHKYNHSLTLSTYALKSKTKRKVFIILLYLHFKNQLQFRLLIGAVTPILVVKAKPSQGSGSPRESITTQKISTTLHEASTGSIFCTPSKSCQKGFRSLPTAQVFCFTLKINYHGRHLLLRGLQV